MCLCVCVHTRASVSTRLLFQRCVWVMADSSFGYLHKAPGLGKEGCRAFRLFQRRRRSRRRKRKRGKQCSFFIMVLLQMDSLYPLVVLAATSLKADHSVLLCYWCIHFFIFKQWCTRNQSFCSPSLGKVAFATNLFGFFLSFFLPPSFCSVCVCVFFQLVVVTHSSSWFSFKTYYRDSSWKQWIIWQEGTMPGRISQLAEQEHKQQWLDTINSNFTDVENLNPQATCHITILPYVLLFKFIYLNYIFKYIQLHKQAKIQIKCIDFFLFIWGVAAQDCNLTLVEILHTHQLTEMAQKKSAKCTHCTHIA